MKSISIQNAYFIKLGRNGQWEQSSIDESKLRIGWSINDISDFNEGRTERIRERWASSTKGAVTRDLTALKHICESTPQDVWITFFSSKLWWCRVESGGIFEDNISRYRKVGGWSDADIHGKPLHVSRISGRLSKVQGFRGTVCRVRNRETLKRLLNDEPSAEYERILIAREALAHNVTQGIKNLHWKDFELLVDLLFRQSGWRRLSMLGETMKYVDLELEDPITHDKYQVQVKSSATLQEFESYARQFSGRGYRGLYFVVHSPAPELANSQSGPSEVRLVLPEQLAEMTVTLGLVDWLMERVK